MGTGSAGSGAGAVGRGGWGPGAGGSAARWGPRRAVGRGAPRPDFHVLRGRGSSGEGGQEAGT